MFSLAPSLLVNRRSEPRLAAGSREGSEQLVEMAVCWHPPPLLGSSICWPFRGGLLLWPPFDMRRASKCFEHFLLPIPHASWCFLWALIILPALLGPSLVSHIHGYLYVPENFSKAEPLLTVWQAHRTVQGPWSNREAARLFWLTLR